MELLGRKTRLLCNPPPPHRVCFNTSTSKLRLWKTHLFSEASKCSVRGTQKCVQIAQRCWGSLSDAWRWNRKMFNSKQTRWSSVDKKRHGDPHLFDVTKTQIPVKEGFACPVREKKERKKENRQTYCRR